MNRAGNLFFEIGESYNYGRGAGVRRDRGVGLGLGSGGGVPPWHGGTAPTKLPSPHGLCPTGTVATTVFAVEVSITETLLLPLLGDVRKVPCGFTATPNGTSPTIMFVTTVLLHVSITDTKPVSSATSQGACRIYRYAKRIGRNLYRCHDSVADGIDH